MAKFRAFKGIRPRRDIVERVAALPYDVYNRQEAKAVVEKEPLSFLAIDRPETQFEPDCDMYADRVYQKAHDMLRNDIAEGIFEQDTQPCFYIYEQNMNGRVQTGLVGCASIDDYQNNIIKKHENTRADKEQDRIKHVDACDAQTGPIFLCYRGRSGVNEKIEEIKSLSPLYDFTASDGVHNRIWAVCDEDDIAFLSKEIDEAGSVYIADGHHRCASAVKVGLKRRAQDPNPTGEKEYDYFLSVLFPDDQLMIMDYNRVVKDLNGLTTDEFMYKLVQKFEIKEFGESKAKPSKKYEFGMYLDDKWYMLIAKEDIRNSDAVEGLDVSILQNEVLSPILGIGDPKTDKRIDFVGGIRGLSELEKRCHNDMKLAFSMYPTSISELFSVADAGRLMPPKSTWFEPKLLSGLFIHDIS